MHIREHFTSRLGFVLAAAGSAIGLGNIWKFPFITGMNGGGAFLVIYVAFVFTIGMAVMLAEYTVGRAGQRNPVGAFHALSDGRGGGAWAGVGFLGVTAGFVILSFYSVVGGWTLAYMIKTVSGALAGADAQKLGAAFGHFIADPTDVIFFHSTFMVLTVGVVIGGVRGGIERATRVLMPLLAILIVILAVRSVTLPGAGKGIAFFLTPDFSKVTGATVVAALGHAFFTLSLGMGAMLTYASYLDKQVNLVKTAAQVTLLDTVFAIVAGFMILPAVFAFGFDPSAGPGLIFITLPAVFGQLPAGEVFAFLFFALLAIAALTSSVSILEPVVSYLIDERNLPRHRATLGAGLVTWALGIPSALSLGPWKDFTIGGKGFLDALDYLASNIMLPVGGMLIAMFVGWSIPARAAEEATSDGTHPFPLVKLWLFTCRFVAPVAVGWVLLNGL